MIDKAISARAVSSDIVILANTRVIHVIVLKCARAFSTDSLLKVVFFFILWKAMVE